MTRPLRAVIDHRALVHNLDKVRAAAPNSAVMAVVKADAYGHGAVALARSLAAAGVEALAVISLAEALPLREAGIELPITALQGPFEADELPLIIAHRLDIVVHQAWQVEALERLPVSDPAAGSGRLRVWLKVDTGMHRLGVAPQEVAALLARLERVSAVRGPVGLFSHLATADEQGSSAAAAQIAGFDALLSAHADPRRPASLANSAGVLGWPGSHHDWVRPGIMLYGSNPFADGRDGSELGLRPVMQLHSALIAVRQLQAGDAIGYGGSWRCPEAMPVGVVAGGYGDGYPRHAAGGTPVLVNGRSVPLIGRVSMDSLCVDLRQCPTAKVGDPVVLWGEQPSIDAIARAAGTIAYELSTRITARVPVEHRYL